MKQCFYLYFITRPIVARRLEEPNTKRKRNTTDVRMRFPSYQVARSCVINASANYFRRLRTTHVYALDGLFSLVRAETCPARELWYISRGMDVSARKIALHTPWWWKGSYGESYTDSRRIRIRAWSVIWISMGLQIRSPKPDPGQITSPWKSSNRCKIHT